MSVSSTGLRLNELLREARLEALEGATASRFESYISLFLRWNKRLNLSSVRNEEGILSRHLVESIAVASTLPQGIGTLLDFGSGAGVPGIPIALCRPEIAVTLAEARGKKAAFLKETARELGIDVKVHAQRAETLSEVFDCVVMRAVDKMPKAVAAAAGLVAPGGWLALMTTDAELAQLQSAAGARFSWVESSPMPNSKERLLALGRNMKS